MPKNSPNRRRLHTATLRSAGPSAADRLTLKWSDDCVEVELLAAGRMLCRGEWKCEIRCNGKPASPLGGWQRVCRSSGKEADYLELQMRLSGGLTLERQIVLARKDRFLLLSDAVLGSRAGRVDFRGTLPLAEEIAFRRAPRTREGWLVHGDGRLASVLPLALGEWRSQPSPGELLPARSGLALHQSAAGRRLLAPLFIDLQRRRLHRPLTWRRLTVAQHMAVQAADVAAGYRVAVGRKQWLIYRSLGPKANRALLGHNLASETLVARFHRSGAVEPIIELE
jgi:hypothetical protein